MAPLGRVVFLGTGAFGVPLLARLPALCDELLIISQPDRPAGRRLQTRPTPVAAWSRGQRLRLETPTRLRSAEGRAALVGFAPDGLLLAAYGQIVPADLLSVGRRRPLNVHPSLLPRHRGAAPVAATILAGDREGGVSLMIMTEELDAGPLAAQWRVQLTGRETTPELEQRLSALAAEVVPAQLERWAGGELEAVAQDDRSASLVRPFHRLDGWIDWRRDAPAIDRQVRALQPWPGAWTMVDGRRLHIRAAHPVAGVAGLPIGVLLPGEWPRVACGQGALALDLVQPEGRSIMSADAWRRGLPRDHVLVGGLPPSRA